MSSPGVICRRCNSSDVDARGDVGLAQCRACQLVFDIGRPVSDRALRVAPTRLATPSTPYRFRDEGGLEIVRHWKDGVQAGGAWA